MNHYLNCAPRGSTDYESITLDVASQNVDEVLQYARTLADEHNVSARRAFADIVRGVYNNLTENYDRKNRKNDQRRRRNR